MNDIDAKKAIESLSHLLNMKNHRITLLPEALDILAWANVARLDNEEVEALRTFARDAAREFQELGFKPKDK